MRRTALGYALIGAGTLSLLLAVYLAQRALAPPPRETRAVHFKLRGDDLQAAGALAPGAQPLLSRSPEAIAAEAKALGTEVPDLRRWWRVDVPSRRAKTLAARLRRDGRIASAFVAPTPELPHVERQPGERSCPVRTPSYESFQGYLSTAPAGIGAPIAWTLPGGRGEGVWVADVEFGWNSEHEDLPGDRMHIIGDQRRYREHGTAVLGELAARDNGLGMVGIVPDVERIVVSSVQNTSAADAIDRAQAELRPGDVLLIELHAVGPRRRFLPMEFWDDIFDVVSVATARGVVVVAAAGNGGENLDHPSYGGKLDRRVRDSGAILVGAGAPYHPGYVDRSRLDFSNYGSRVDVQGWGREVATVDYGDLQDCEAEDRRYTRRFAGTSSASPIVTGAAVAIQGALRGAGRAPLAPRAIRTLLSKTGSPQTDGPFGDREQQIGPRPDLATALDELELF